jgi:3-deoxy-D-manno-octulosonate 8-phosphate phosphatase KdsC-like HAD superfamily phosphatase
MKISVLLSDYDGTLSPTTFLNPHNKIKNEAFNNNYSKTSELERILWEISSKITIGIISTKDFNFLHYRTRFTNIISCMMSIETIIIKHIKSDECYKYDCIKKSILNIDSDILHKNSQQLYSIIDKISSKFKDLSIDRKLTFKNNLLAGITIDWRHLNDWNLIKKEVEPCILDIMKNEINNNNSEYSLYIQRYSTHPFVNESHINRLENKNIIYFGDSENDNPAFRKTDISIGIKSDERLNPKLDCQYLINFNQLPTFLMNLLKNDFIFSENLL